MKQQVLNIPTKNIVRSILEVINPFIGHLTSQEILLLEIMINNSWTILTNDNRVAIRLKSNLEKYTFNNYIKKLKDKKVLIIENEVLLVNPKIALVTNTNSLNINFNE